MTARKKDASTAPWEDAPTDSETNVAVYDDFSRFSPSESVDEDVADDELVTPEKETLSRLKELSLLGTEEKIPSFEETLALVNGRSPLIVEIKGTSTDTAVCAAAAEALDNYAGEYCIESFNPVYVGWWKKNRPSVVRGQLSCKMPKQKGIVEKLKFFALGNMLLNFISRPDFIAYEHHGSGRLAFRLARALDGIPVAWTVRSKSELEKAKKHFVSFIFENEEETLG